MIKINSLKVEQLKDLLRERELPSAGQKAELVHRLSEAMQSDEIYFAGENNYDTASGLTVDDGTKMLKAQVNSLENMMKDLMSVVQTHIVNPSVVKTTGNENLTNRVDSVRMNAAGNSFENIRDMASLMPDFNPMMDTSLNSVQFIKRIEMLKNAYNWSDNTLLFVVQQKLNGSAKLWVDSQEIFVSWQQFKGQFLKDFPCDDNGLCTHKNVEYVSKSE